MWCYRIYNLNDCCMKEVVSLIWWSCRMTVSMYLLSVWTFWAAWIYCQFFSTPWRHIYLFVNKYKRWLGGSCDWLLILLLQVPVGALSKRLIEMSKILLDIMHSLYKREVYLSVVVLSVTWVMFKHALWSASSCQALIACSHMYHANHWRSRTIDTPRIRRGRGHRLPEY